MDESDIGAIVTADGIEIVIEHVGAGMNERDVDDGEDQ